MLWFWIMAALISSAAALLMLFRASRAERRSESDDPTLDVYRRQLHEIDEMAERGLLGAEERKAARAEAGRRLLGQAERREAPARAMSARTAHRLVTAAAVAAPLLALGGYMLIGSPGFPDQPYKARLKSWERLSRTDPGRLTPAEMAAVLQPLVAERPRDPRARYFLAEAEAAAGDLPAAADDMQKATALDPTDAKAWTLLGIYLGEASGKPEVPAAALEAFRKAVSLDPNAFEPRYILARAEIASGQTAQGLADWRALLASLPANDPRRPILGGEIDDVARTGRLPSAQQADASQGPAEGPQEAAFIQSMVDRLAARLKAQPDDPAGWARLIRAYGVLHQTDRQAAAEAQARRLFKDRPQALKTALAGQAVPPPAS